MTEQSGPRELVGYAVDAERVGFDFEVSSDHYSPWLTSQGHAPYAWTVLGAVAQATTSIELATYVTCPIQRYHPAVVAQKAATLQILSGGRFILGLGSGENLNEHVTGEGWPPVAQRQDMLEEAITIIRELLTGELITWGGDYFRVDSARIWDAPEGSVPIGVAVSGDKSIQRFAPLAEHLIAVEPDPELITSWSATNSHPGSRSIGQVPICWDPDRDTAVARAHDQFRWFAGGWAVNADLPTPPASPGRVSSSAPRTSPTRSSADPIWTRSSRVSGPTGMPGSPTSLWSRSATRDSSASSTRRRDRCWRRSGPPPGARLGDRPEGACSPKKMMSACAPGSESAVSCSPTSSSS